MKATVLLGEFQDGTEQWAGGVGVEFEWKTDKRGTTSSSGNTVTWFIRGYRRWLVTIVAFLRVVLLSRVGISILYPLAMFAAALVTALVMLWRVL